MDEVLAKILMRAREVGIYEADAKVFAYNIIILLTRHKKVWSVKKDFMENDCTLRPLFSLVSACYGVVYDGEHCYLLGSEIFENVRGGSSLVRDESLIVVYNSVDGYCMYEYGIVKSKFTRGVYNVVQQQRALFEEIFNRIGIETYCTTAIFSTNGIFSIID